MSDETKCAKCGHDRTEHNGPRAECDRCMCVLFVATPPTPDPRERVNYAAMMAARDENELDAAGVVDAYLADHGVRWSPGAAQMAADLLALEARRAPVRGFTEDSRIAELVRAKPVCDCGRCAKCERYRVCCDILTAALTPDAP